MAVELVDAVLTSTVQAISGGDILIDFLVPSSGPRRSSDFQFSLSKFSTASEKSRGAKEATANHS